MTAANPDENILKILFILSRELICALCVLLQPTESAKSAGGFGRRELAFVLFQDIVDIFETFWPGMALFIQPINLFCSGIIVSWK